MQMYQQWKENQRRCTKSTMCRGKGKGGGKGGGNRGGKGVCIGGATTSTITTTCVQHTCCWNILHARMEIFTDDVSEEI